MRRQRLAAIVLAGTLGVPGCGRDDRVPARVDVGEGQEAVIDTTGLPDDIYIAEPQHEDTSPPLAIYYDLTRHDWYARGEPLVHDGRAHIPAGLVAASGAEMEFAGEFGGVMYYWRAGGVPDSVFVPVFERYWLAFTPDTAPARVR